MSRVIAALLGIAALLTADTFDDLSARATAAREANDVAHAIELYRQAVQLKPTWQEGWWFLGSLAYDSDQYAAGQEALTRFVALDDKAAAGWSLLGLCEFETGAYLPSLQHIQRALQLGTGVPAEMLPALRFHEAQLLTHAGLFDQALQKYLWFAHNGTQSPALNAAIGLAGLRAPSLVKDIPADKQDLYSVAGLTTYFWMGGNFQKADEGFHALLERFPNQPGVHYLYASYLLPASPDQALAELQRELALHPNSGDALGMLALIALQHDDLVSALTYARQALEQNSAVPLANYVFGLATFRNGDAATAIPSLEKAATADPSNLEYHLALAGAYSKAGRVTETRRERSFALALARGTLPDAAN